MDPQPAGISRSNIVAIATSLRDDGVSPVFCFGTETSPIALGSCQIYAVKFPDEATWAIRIPLYANSSLPPASITCITQLEIETLMELRDAGFRWSPKLVGGDSSFDNPIGNPYLVTDWILGEALEWKDTLPIEKRQKVIRQLVDIQLELLNYTKKSEPGLSTLKYLRDIIDGKVVRVLRGDLPELDIRSCFVHRVLTRHVVDGALETSLSAFAHENLASHKIIVDEGLNIQGIIDWKLAWRRPLQMAARFPRLLTIEPDDTLSSALLGDDPAGAIRTLSPFPKLSADRKFVGAYLSSLIPDGASSRSTEDILVASTVNSIISDPDVDWKDLIVRSCFSKGLHKWMAEQSWLIHSTKDNRVLLSDEVVNKEIDDFLEAMNKAGSLTREELTIVENEKR